MLDYERKRLRFASRILNPRSHRVLSRRLGCGLLISIELTLDAAESHANTADLLDHGRILLGIIHYLGFIEKGVRVTSENNVEPGDFGCQVDIANGVSAVAMSEVRETDDQVASGIAESFNDIASH